MYYINPAIFVRCLVEGLRQHWPGLGEKLLQLAVVGDGAVKNPRLVASLLVNDLVRNDANPLLVLDDSHELNEPALHILLQELISNVPSGASIFIAGRTSMPLNLSHLHLAGTARHIGASELTFSRDEIATLLAERHGPQPSETVEEIENYTGGWPVALELAHKYVAIQEKYQMVESLPSAYSNLAYVYFELGDYEQAEALVRKVLELHYQHGEERFFLLLNRMVLAWCRLARGQWVEARQIVDETLAAAEQQVDQVCSMVQMLAGTALALMGSLFKNTPANFCVWVRG